MIPSFKEGDFVTARQDQHNFAISTQKEVRDTPDTAQPARCFGSCFLDMAGEGYGAIYLHAKNGHCSLQWQHQSVQMNGGDGDGGGTASPGD
ncbi:hypothetical protein Pmani_009740 [Petrolisthes manimaculis]|uniref:Uncharacterized protein n=1 Tax=Petrolisthes manimaculis TaxID=1843537 RepID=A0AAE1UHE6_9EUCA|nr:hypothetical protein Pmani_009736 [Petrolisthes manimaculis]KAK4319280.1 hypothetical protein Pmani_009740 [Petrolisthes manimaculis]